MKEVGAQHLVCVNQIGFPDSMAADVRMKYGPTVRLVVLDESVPNCLDLLGASPWMLVKKPVLEVLPIDPDVTLRPPAFRGDSFTNRDAVFFIGDSKQGLTVSELAKDWLDLFGRNDGTTFDEDNTMVIDLATLPVAIWYQSLTCKHRVKKFRVTVRVTAKARRVPLQIMGYRQEVVGGHVAWIASTIAAESGEPSEVEILFFPSDNGYRVTASGRLASLQVHLNGEPTEIDYRRLS